MKIKKLNVEMEQFPDGCNISDVNLCRCAFNDMGYCILTRVLGKGALYVNRNVDTIPINCPLRDCSEDGVKPEKQIRVFIGPSGSGKTTLAGLTKEMFPETLEFVSTTSRFPRQGEVDGVDYHFVTRDEFEEKLENGDFIESVEYSGNYYGLTKAAVYEALDKSNKCVVVVDINGYQMLQNMFKDDKTVDLKAVFVKTDISNLFLRMRNRGDSEASILKRLDNLIATKEFDNEQYCDFIINNNREIEEVVNDLKKIF